MSSVSEGGTPPFLSKRFQVVRLVLFCGVTFRMEVSARGLGGVSVEVEFLEGVAWYCVGMVSWVTVGLAFFWRYCHVGGIRERFGWCKCRGRVFWGNSMVLCRYGIMG